MLISTKNREKGFTLTELLIAMAISGIILGTIGGTFIIQRKSFGIQEQVTEMIQTARASMDMITREVRMAGYDPAGAGFVGIPYNSSQLQIIADLDGDASTAGPNENITYSYDGTNLRIVRNTGGGNQPFAENVQGFTFEYLDTSGVASSITANIRQIKITITTRTGKPDPNYSANGGFRTYTLTSLITPRNLAL